MKTKEEILNNHNSEGLLTTPEVLEAMEEYAQQFSQPTELRDELDGFLEFYMKKYEMSFSDNYKLFLINEYLKQRANVCTSKDLEDSERKL